MWAILLLSSVFLLGQAQGSAVMPGDGDEYVTGYFSDGFWCDDGYTALQDLYVCVKIVDKKMKWEDAREYCQNDGRDLLQIKDAKTNLLVEELLNPRRRYWIGIKDQRDGIFKYAEGQALGNYQPWGKRQPSTSGKKYQCVEMIGKSGLWNDRRCAIRRQFLCEGWVAVSKK